jgi:hypothetical protein
MIKKRKLTRKTVKKIGVLFSIFIIMFYMVLPINSNKNEIFAIEQSKQIEEKTNTERIKNVIKEKAERNSRELLDKHKFIKNDLIMTKQKEDFIENCMSEIPKVKNLEIIETPKNAILLKDSLGFEVYYTITPLNTSKYIKSNVNIRNGPSTEFEIIGSFKLNDKIDITGECEGWYQIKYIKNNEALLAFVSSEYTMDEKYVPPFNPDNYFVKKEGNVDDSFIIQAENLWNTIPEYIRNFLKSKGCKIYITDTNLSERFFPNDNLGSVAGTTVPIELTVYLEDRKNAIKNSLVHEVGHLIDVIHLTSSEELRFKEIFEAEKNIFLNIPGADDYALTNSSEYFAEAFVIYLKNPNELIKNCPKTYEYIHSIITNIIE